jgi:predicted enzyme related to lactoylglutathione lyase
LDKYPLHTIVYFVDDIDSTASAYAKLFNASVEVKPHFNVICAQGMAFGFHPADEKSPAGTTVAYFKTEDLELAIANADAAGFELHRGPIEIDGEKIAQLRNDQGMRIGLVQKL